MRYVDDFIILHKHKNTLEKSKEEINNYLISNLKLELHPNKSKIILLRNGVNLLGYRVFYYYKLLRNSNKKKFQRIFNEKLKMYKEGFLDYEEFFQRLQGWFGYAMWANTYKLRNSIIKIIEDSFKKTNQLTI